MSQQSWCSIDSGIGGSLKAYMGQIYTNEFQGIDQVLAYLCKPSFIEFWLAYALQIIVYTKITVSVV